MTAAIKEFCHKVVVNFVVKCAVKMEFLRLILNQIEANETTHKNQQSIDRQRKSRSFNNYGICYILERMTGIEPASPAWEAGALPLDDIRIFHG